MFDGIRRRWREAQASQLRLEVEDTVRRLPTLGPEVNTRVALHLAAAERLSFEQYGPLANLSADGKLSAAKLLRG